MLLPGASPAIRLRMDVGSLSGLPPIAISTSPGLMPAASAGPPAHNSGDQDAGARRQLQGFRNLGSDLSGSTPIHPRLTEPLLMIDSSTCFALDAGIAKPIPSDPPLRE